MKKILMFLFSLIYAFAVHSQNVGIGTAAPNASAILDVSSINSGLLPPRMSVAERDAISTPAAGLIIYNTTTGAIEFYNGSTWFNISAVVANSVSAASPVKKMFGGSAGDFFYGITPTSDGGYIIAGMSTNPTGVGSSTGTLTGIISYGLSDGWIIKLDGRGIIQWQKLYGGTLDERLLNIQQTADGGYIVVGDSFSSNSGSLTGVTSNGDYDYFIMKLDNTGNIQWQKLLGGNSVDRAYSVRQTADGGYIVVGDSFSSNTGSLSGFTNFGGSDLWVIKLNASGTILWQKLMGGVNNESASTIQQTTDGGYIIGGYSISNNTGNLLGLTNNGALDFWIVKLDVSGNLQWQKLVGGSSNDNVTSVTQTADGGYIVAGTSSSSNTGTLTGFTGNGLNDIWIIKMDAFGNFQWQKLHGGSGDDFSAKIIQTADGGYIMGGTSSSSVAGTFNLNTNGGNDFYMLKLSSGGNLEWHKIMGGSLADFCNDMCKTPDGGFIIIGNSNSANTGTLTGVTGYGGQDGLIIKTDKFGNPL